MTTFRMIVVFVLLAINACARSLPHEIPGSEEFFRLTPEERSERIVAYSPEDQVALYLTSRYMEPPDYGMVLAMAEEGAKVLPAILDRLSAKDREYEVPALIRLIYLMDRDGYYPVAADEKVMATLEARYESMTIPQVKELCTANLDKLRSKAKAAGHAVR